MGVRRYEIPLTGAEFDFPPGATVKAGVPYQGENGHWWVDFTYTFDEADAPRIVEGSRSDGSEAEAG
jgi:hypothetical protein